MARCYLFSKSKSWFPDFQYNPNKDEADKVRNTLLVVAALIAAVTFQAGVNPPGGVWQEYTVYNATICANKSADEGAHPSCYESHDAGTAIYASRGAAFYVFLLFNTVALSTSVLVIMSLTYSFPFDLEVFIATASMLATYASAIFSVTPANYSYRSRFILIAAALPFVLRGLIYILKCIANQGKEDLCDACNVQKTSGNSGDNYCRICRREIPKKDVGSEIPK